MLTNRFLRLHFGKKLKIIFKQIYLEKLIKMSKKL